jgi:hypothetical protein
MATKISNRPPCVTARETTVSHIVTKAGDGAFVYVQPGFGVDNPPILALGAGLRVHVTETMHVDDMTWAHHEHGWTALMFLHQVESWRPTLLDDKGADWISMSVE